MTWTYHADPRPDIQAVVGARGCRFLDVGCGTGALGIALKAAGASHVAGVEAHPGAANTARETLDVLIEGNVLTVSLPFAPGEFDYLIFADVLEHLTDPGAALRKCLRYLAPNGRVVISVPNMRFYLVLLRLVVDRWAYADAGIRDRTHLRIFTKRSLVTMAAAEGLCVERLTRNYRLFDDQSTVGLVGALATRIVCATLAPLLFRDLMAYQYVAILRRATDI